MKLSKRTLDENYMRMAFDKAFEHLGSTKNNPSVGCIVVKNNSVISTGKTSLMDVLMQKETLLVKI